MTLKPFPGMLLGQAHSAPPGFPNQQWNTTSAGSNGLSTGGDVVRGGEVTQDAAGGTTVQVIGLYGQATGKFYFEVKVDRAIYAGASWVGVAPALSPAAALGVTNFGSHSYGCVLGTDGVMINADGGGGRSLTSPFGYPNDIQVAVDLGAHKIWFGVAGVWLNGTPGVSGGDVLLAATTYYPVCAIGASPGINSLGARWGGTFDPFDYTPPTGFNAWHS